MTKAARARYTLERRRRALGVVERTLFNWIKAQASSHGRSEGPARRACPGGA